MNHKTIYKIMAVIFFLVIGLSTSAQHVHAEGSLSITGTQNPYVTPGAMFKTTVSMEGASSIVGYQMRFTYDPISFELLTIENDPNLTGHLEVSHDDVLGTLTVNFLQIETPISGAQDLFTLVFLVDEAIDQNVSHQVLVLDETYRNEFVSLTTDPHDIVVQLADYDFSSTVEYGIYGDLDGDDHVSVFDGAMLQQHLAGAPLLNPKEADLADVDLDGDTTIIDVALIQQYIAGLIDYLGTEPMHVISFDSLGGTPIQPLIRVYGETVAVPDEPIKVGHSFNGWYLEETYDNQVVFPYEVTGTATIYAKWDINDYTITFDSNGGSAVLPLTEDYQSPVEEPDEPIREGHTFAGWFEDDDTFLVPYTFDLMPVDGITLYANWSINTYTITFDSKGGSAVPLMSEEYMTPIEAPDDPTYVGRTFAGWFEDQAFTIPYEFQVMPSFNDILYAKWVIQITFESNGGSVVNPIVQEPMTFVELPVPLKSGYEFLGWYDSSEFVEPAYTDNIMPDSSLTLYAKWLLVTYEVTFDTNGGSSIGPLPLVYGTELDSYVSSRPGYTFTGWYTDESYQERIYTVPNVDVTVYTYWQNTDVLTLIPVGEVLTTYTIPTGTDDSETALVSGGYLMSQTEITYQFWYDVKDWAEDHGYVFQNPGREGSLGIIGLEPTENAMYLPVTTISWRDAIVWTNALSEMMGFIPVYQSEFGTIIKDSTDANQNVVDTAIQTSNTGFRLPTSIEWEMAARWTNDTDSTNGSIFVGGRYWTPGNVASGANDNTTEETNRVGWFYYSTDFPEGIRSTQPVGSKAANDLGLYDMSGNVAEWNSDLTLIFPGTKRLIHGGSYYQNTGFLQVGQVDSNHPDYTTNSLGFRVVREGLGHVYQVSFYDHEGIIETQLINHGHEAIAPEAREVEGYTFIGWNVDFSAVIETMIVSAVYEVNQYQMTFDTSGGDPMAPLTLDYGTSLWDYVPTKGDDIFIGWYLEETFETLVETVPSENQILYAKWDTL